MKNKLLLTALLMVVTQGCAIAKEITFTDQTAIIAIIGEAEGESQTGRIAIAEVIRRRGSLKGIYGATSKRVRLHQYSKETEMLARAAWVDSQYTNYSKKADGWGNANDLKIFKRQAWFKHCIIVAHIGNHYFWKKV